VAVEDATPYEVCRVAGRVRRVWIDPVNRTIEATVDDGTGSVNALWAMHAEPHLEILPGGGLILEGVLRIDRAGRLSMIEPVFEVVRDPESLPHLPVDRDRQERVPTR
jgi:hypothetical protein